MARTDPGKKFWWITGIVVPIVVGAIALIPGLISDTTQSPRDNLVTPSPSDKTGSAVDEPQIVVLSEPVSLVSVNSCEYRANHVFRIRLSGTRPSQLTYHVGRDRGANGSYTVVKSGEVYLDVQNAGEQSASLSKSGFLTLIAYYGDLKSDHVSKRYIDLFDAEGKQTPGCGEPTFHIAFKIFVEASGVK